MEGRSGLEMNNYTEEERCTNVANSFGKEEESENIIKSCALEEASKNILKNCALEEEKNCVLEEAKNLPKSCAEEKVVRKFFKRHNFMLRAKNEKSCTAEEKEFSKEEYCASWKKYPRNCIEKQDEEVVCIYTKHEKSAIEENNPRSCTEEDNSSVEIYETTKRRKVKPKLFSQNSSVLKAEDNKSPVRLRIINTQRVNLEENSQQTEGAVRELKIRRKISHRSPNRFESMVDERNATAIEDKIHQKKNKLQRGPNNFENNKNLMMTEENSHYLEEADPTANMEEVMQQSCDEFKTISKKRINKFVTSVDLKIIEEDESSDLQNHIWTQRSNAWLDGEDEFLQNKVKNKRFHVIPNYCEIDNHLRAIEENKDTNQLMKKSLYSTQDKSEPSNRERKIYSEIELQLTHNFDEEYEEIKRDVNHRNQSRWHKIFGKGRKLGSECLDEVEKDEDIETVVNYETKLKNSKKCAHKSPKTFGEGKKCGIKCLDEVVQKFIKNVVSEEIRKHGINVGDKENEECANAGVRNEHVRKPGVNASQGKNEDSKYSRRLHPHGKLGTNVKSGVNEGFDSQNEDLRKFSANGRENEDTETNLKDPRKFSIHENGGKDKHFYDSGIQTKDIRKGSANSNSKKAGVDVKSLHENIKQICANTSQRGNETNEDLEIHDNIRKFNAAANPGDLHNNLRELGTHASGGENAESEYLKNQSGKQDRVTFDLPEAKVVEGTDVHFNSEETERRNKCSSSETGLKYQHSSRKSKCCSSEVCLRMSGETEDCKNEERRRRSSSRESKKKTSIGIDCVGKRQALTGYEENKLMIDINELEKLKRDDKNKLMDFEGSYKEDFDLKRKSENYNDINKLTDIKSEKCESSRKEKLDLQEELQILHEEDLDTPMKSQKFECINEGESDFQKELKTLKCDVDKELIMKELTSPSNFFRQNARVQELYYVEEKKNKNPKKARGSAESKNVNSDKREVGKEARDTPKNADGTSCTCSYLGTSMSPEGVSIEEGNGGPDDDRRTYTLTKCYITTEIAGYCKFENVKMEVKNQCCDCYTNTEREIVDAKTSTKRSESGVGTLDANLADSSKVVNEQSVSTDEGAVESTPTDCSCPEEAEAEENAEDGIRASTEDTSPNIEENNTFDNTEVNEEVIPVEEAAISSLPEIKQLSGILEKEEISEKSTGAAVEKTDESIQCLCEQLNKSLLKCDPCSKIIDLTDCSIVIVRNTKKSNMGITASNELNCECEVLEESLKKSLCQKLGISDISPSDCLCLDGNKIEENIREAEASMPAEDVCLVSADEAVQPANEDEDASMPAEESPTGCLTNTEEADSSVIAKEDNPLDGSLVLDTGVENLECGKANCPVKKCLGTKQMGGTKRTLISAQTAGCPVRGKCVEYSGKYSKAPMGGKNGSSKSKKKCKPCVNACLDASPDIKGNENELANNPNENINEIVGIDDSPEDKLDSVENKEPSGCRCKSIAEIIEDNKTAEIIEDNNMPAVKTNSGVQAVSTKDTKSTLTRPPKKKVKKVPSKKPIEFPLYEERPKLKPLKEVIRRNGLNDESECMPTRVDMELLPKEQTRVWLCDDERHKSRCKSCSPPRCPGVCCIRSVFCIKTEQYCDCNNYHYGIN